MRQFVIFLILLSSAAFSQSPDFYPQELWRVSSYGMAFNVEVHDINNDGKQDIIVGNWNDTYVYYDGAGVLNNTVDVTYTGRMLAVCDYNGDGYKDLIAMHFTNYDSSRFDYDGEILFYYGSNTTELAIDTIPEYCIPLPTQYPTRDEFSLGLDRPGIEYGDFNNDGKMDIVIMSRTIYGKLDIYMGNGIPPDTVSYSIEGKVIPGEVSIINYGEYFQAGDINGDGYDDLLLSSKRNKVPPVPNPKDSLDVLHIYLGSDNFEFNEDGESIKYESRLKNDNYSYGWFKREFSVMDINSDGISDLIIAHFHKDSTNHIHYNSQAGIDTIPSFYISDPDTTKQDVIVGYMCHNIGDFNNDGYNDFILKQSYIKSFSLHLGGPHISNENPYGLRGLLEAVSSFPTKAINRGDQNGDGVKDFVVTAYPFSNNYMGYLLVFLGNPNIVTVIDELQASSPSGYDLLQNYPNPFNPSTIINYKLKNKNSITLKIYDILGKELITLINNEEKDAGDYKIEFDAIKYKLASGVYVYKLQAGDFISSKKMILLK